MSGYSPDTIADFEAGIKRAREQKTAAEKNAKRTRDELTEIENRIAGYDTAIADFSRLVALMKAENEVAAVSSELAEVTF